MKLLYTTEYSGPNICGVWTRVKNEALWMAERGHKVYIFSTDINKQGGSLIKYERMHENIHVHRFKPWLKISDNSSFWYGKDFKEKALAIKPDIIICNTYRHPETNFCQGIAKKLNVPCVLVTHASFEAPRGKLLNAATWVYDKVHNINKFDAIFRISNWEIPYLKKFNNYKPCYHVPNAIPDEIINSYNKLPKKPFAYDILFLGRIAPIKDIPTLLYALKESPQYRLTLAGPFDNEYRKFLVNGMDVLGIQDRTCFVGPIDNIQEKIETFNEHDIFILPSKREGLPQALIEAMALGKICIASRTQGACEVIKDGVNGFLFDIGDYKQLAEILRHINGLDIYQRHKLESIKSYARQTALCYSASNIYPRTERIYLELINK